MTRAASSNTREKCRSWRDIFVVIWTRRHTETQRYLFFNGGDASKRGNASSKANTTITGAWIKFSKNFIRISLQISVLNFKLQQRAPDSTLPPKCLRNSIKISGPNIGLTGLHTIILGMDEPRWTGAVLREGLSKYLHEWPRQTQGELEGGRN